MKRVNAVIVGAGAGGGIVAKELATAGLSVVLLERGKWYTANDCRKDDLRNQRGIILGCAFGPEDKGHPRVWVDANGVPQTCAQRRRRSTRTWPPAWAAERSVGERRPGDLCLRISRCVPPTARPREARWKTGPSHTATWSRSTRKPSTRSASPATTRLIRFMARASAILPMPPLPPTQEFSILEPAAKRLGLHPFQIPMCRNSVPYNGRGPCMRCRWCDGYICETDAKNGTHNTVIPIALNTGNCELRTECTVKEILTDERGRARGVAYFDGEGHLQEQLADIVIVSASATESARLLLNSKSRLFPNGLGNRYDQVGRHLAGPSILWRNRLLRLRNLRRRRSRRLHRHLRL